MTILDELWQKRVPQVSKISVLVLSQEKDSHQTFPTVS